MIEPISNLKIQCAHSRFFRIENSAIFIQKKNLEFRQKIWNGRLGTVSTFTNKFNGTVNTFTNEFNAVDAVVRQ